MKSRMAADLPSLRGLIVKGQLISESQLIDIDRLIGETGINFSTALMFKGYCSPLRISQLLKEKVSIHTFPLKTISGLGKLKNLISEEKAKDLQVFPLTLIEETGQRVLLLGMTDPLDIASIRKVEFLTHLKVQPAFLSLDDLQNLYMKFFRRGLEIFPVEVSFMGKVVSKGRADAIQAEYQLSENPVREKAMVSALVRILVQKKIMTEREFEEEVDKVLLEAKKLTG